MSNVQDWELQVWKRDQRCTTGLRMVKTYMYTNWTQEQMAAEVQDLRNTCYKATDGWCLKFNAYKTKVRNLMTGAEVEIRTKDVGGVCDPSQERYWSM